MTRREWIASAAAAAARPAVAAPTAPVSIAKCGSYGTELVPTLEKMFDQLGGLGRLVKGKTVAMKVNLTGNPDTRMNHVPAELAHWTHPRVIGATIHLMHKAGARRVRILECGTGTDEPLEEFMYQANWQPELMLNAGGIVEMENTNGLGFGKRYHKLVPANGGLLFPEYWLNHSYEECDVFVSIAKLKEHATAGVTGAMKNLFGLTPCTIYGDGADPKEPGPTPRGGRGSVFHQGSRQPCAIAAPEKDPKSSREGGYRVPRAVADLVSARPVHLSIIDGIETMVGGEGPWNGTHIKHIKPHVLLAGTNCVTTDAIATTVMGFDPMADRGATPFERCDNMMALAEGLGVGTRNPKQIEVAGTPVADVRVEFRKHWGPVTRPRW
jgi:uncharacterized protein (DUF362 family)